MLEWLEHIDRLILLAINGANSPFLDQLMWIISGKLTWIPLYLLLFYLAYKQFGIKGSLLFLCCIVLAIAIADQSSVYLFKNVFERYRPSHNLELQDSLHLYQFANGELYYGGKFGFVSSHAANFAVLTSFCLLILKRNKWLVIGLIFAHGLVCYSRVYLGVHYPSDVTVGTLVGVLASIIPVILFRKFWVNREKTSESDSSI